MLWIPGGMFDFHATGASAMYDGSRFARDGGNVNSASTAERIGRRLAEKLGVDATRDAIAAVSPERVVQSQIQLREDLVARVNTHQSNGGYRTQKIQNSHGQKWWRRPTQPSLTPLLHFKIQGVAFAA
jgi:carboxylesterase type B